MTDWRDEHHNTQLSTTPFPLRNYQPCNLALPSPCFSFREMEELLAERGITVTYETVRHWARSLARPMLAISRNDKVAWGDAWHLDEVFMSIQGEQQYLWRAVDQDSDTIAILVQRRRHKKSAERFFRRLIKGQGRAPRWLITDKLKSYDAAHRTMMPTINHINTIHANTRAGVSHQPTRQQEYHMRAFSSSSQAQRFLTIHGLTQTSVATSSRQSIIDSYTPRPFRSGRTRCAHKRIGENCSIVPAAG